MPRPRLEDTARVQRLCSRLADDIRCGRFVEHLPGERSLARHFDVTVREARAAMRLLAEQGLIQRGPRRRAAITAEAAPPGGGRSIERICIVMSRNLRTRVYGNRMIDRMESAIRGRGLSHFEMAPEDVLEQCVAPAGLASPAVPDFGLLLVELPPKDTVAAAVEAGVPVVCLDDAPPGLADRVNVVGFDEIASVFRAADYLLTLGHRRLGLVQLQSEDSVAVRRREGLTRALQKHGLGDEAAEHVHA